MALTKATIKNLEAADIPFECLFNPTEYTAARTVNWNKKPANGRNIPFVEYTGGDNATMNLQLLFDCNEPRNIGGRQVHDVRFFIKKLEDYMKPTILAISGKTMRKRPPFLLFQWGDDYKFKAVLTSLSVRYTLFKESGEPVRATADISLLQVADEQQPGTNPTSRSEPGYKRRIVMPHDTLALIAYEEYGDSNQWRSIAGVNEIEDPMKLQAGQVLAIPPLR